MSENVDNNFEKPKSRRARVKSEAKGFVTDFKSFAFKGNVIDLAVGVVIGTAFNSIVQSFANDIIMPPIGKLLGNSAFKELYINLSNQSYVNLAAADAAGAPVIRYGLFLSNLLNFLILALTLFIVLRYFLRFKREETGK